MPSSRNLATASLAAIVLTLGACAAIAPSNAGRFASVPAGTVMTYSRTSTGSYGSGQAQVAWTQGEATWQGKKVVASVSPQAGANYWDPATHGLVAVLAPNGQPQYSFDPPVTTDWPLQVGKSWTTRHQMTVHAQQRTMPIEYRNTVEAREEIQVPAGRFMTWRIVTNNSFGERQVVWTAPERGIPTVKRSLSRPATHPQGAGTLEGELVSLVMPGR